MKTLLAALWLAFRLDLDSPNTAMSTALILALPSSGMLLEKSFYRLLGTLAGCAGALLLIGLFPQQAVPLFLGLALWVGACTSGAALFRNARSYSFVLAGYTASTIVLPALDQPAQAFALAVTRVSEVGLAIICSAVVNDALFVNPTFNWVRLAQRVPVRIRIDALPAGMTLIAGTTCTVVVKGHGG